MRLNPTRNADSRMEGNICVFPQNFPLYYSLIDGYYFLISLDKGILVHLLKSLFSDIHHMPRTRCIDTTLSGSGTTCHNGRLCSTKYP